MRISALCRANVGTHAVARMNWHTLIPRMFSTVFCRGRKISTAKDFWAGVKDVDPRFQMLHREANLSKQDLKNCIPLWLHGAGVEYVDGRSLMVYSMGSVLATGSTLDTTLLLAAISKDICWQTSWDTLFEKWVASFTHLQGPRSVGQYSFTLWAIRGDQEFFANSLKLPHWRNPRPCWECNVDGAQRLNIQGPIPPNEMRQVEDECRARRSPHLIFTIPEVSHFSICQDAMHILFCKGVLSNCMENTQALVLAEQSRILCWPAAQGTVGNNLLGDSAVLQAVPDHGCA